MRLQFLLRVAIDGKELDPKLARLLEALHSHGSLAAAARSIGCSYRFAWDRVRQAQCEYGYALVHLERGRGARLSEFARHLADAQASARTQTERALERVARASEARMGKQDSINTPGIALAASHDLGLIELKQFCALAASPLVLDIRFCGSLEALAQLSRNRCDFAGFHVGPEAHDETQLRRLLSPRLHQLIVLTERRQGLMTAPGNPKKIRAIADLARRGIRFVNRQPSSGTRLLIDRLLARSGTRTQAIRGYETEEFTHLAVAATIAAGHADAGFGIEAAAASYGLDFVPVARETYYLAARRSQLDHSSSRVLLAHLRSASWRKRLNRLRGYRAVDCGRIVDIEVALSGPTA